jgi:4-hydroxybenzoate polyprenyltransferase
MMWARIQRYGEMVRFSHTLFAMPFALLASVWAWVVPGPDGISVPFRWTVLIGIVACMVAARSFAMAFNRLVDARFDAENPRTANRHLPAGLLGRREVAGFAAACAVAFVASTLLFLPNPLPWMLSLPVLAVLAGYSLGKRFTWMVHFWLGLALMLAPICAWIAIRGEVVMATPVDLWPATVLGILVLLWVAGFDILYACQDEAYDRGAGLHSIPARFGLAGALNIARFLHATMFGVAVWMSFAFPQLSLGWLFRLALVGIGGLLIAEHRAVSPSSLEKMQLAFFQLNIAVSVIFLLAGGLDALWR